MSQTYQYSKTPIAAAVSAALVAPAAALAQQEEGASALLDEIIVTSRKRTENMQGIPASIQAIPEAMLKEMGALSTEDYVRFMPSVNWINFSGGGSNRVVFRGVSTGTANFIAKSSSSIYLDETPVTSTNGASPDFRMLDIQRVEALNGPQGTLFGAAAQAGTLRVITNKPDASGFEASADAMLRSGDESDASHSISGMVNIPLVEDVFAIRIAAQVAEDGGFVDNVLGHSPDSWWGYSNDGTGMWANRLNWGQMDNADVVEDNWNTVEHTAARIGARWTPSDKVTVDLTYNYGESEAQAGPDYNPYVGDLEIIQWTKDHRTDEWDMASLTIEADLGFAQLVSSTSFFDRTTFFSQDATIYYKYYAAWACEERTDAAYYYWLSFTNPNTNQLIYYPLYCPAPAVSVTGDPSQIDEFVGLVEGPSFQDRFSQELRLSHQGETFDWLGGIYYEDSNDNWDAVWMKGAGDYQATHSVLAIEQIYGQPFPDAEYIFLSTDRTEWKQKAVFGEVTWHITDTVDATLGGRWFETKNTKQYRKYHGNHTGNSGFQVPGVPRPDFDVDTGGAPAHAKLDEFVPKFNISWNFADDMMLFASYTEGFRTGGVNRTTPRTNWDITVFGQAWEPDLLKNTEIGLKSRFADGRVQLNVSLFNMDWEDLQTEVLDPSYGECLDPTDPGPCFGNDAQPWLKLVGNSGDAHSRGVALDFMWIPAEGWDIGGNIQLLDAQIDKAPPFSRTGIEKGQKLPNVPERQGSFWVTKSWPVSFVQGGEMFFRAQHSFQSNSVTKLVPADESSWQPQWTNKGYAITDLRFGLISTEGDWQVDLFMSNITDKRAQIYQGGSSEWQWARSGEYDHMHHMYTVRPREYGIRYSQSWGE